MKILMVGSNKVWAIENIYQEELKQMANVQLFNAHGVFHDYYYTSLFNKVSFRLGNRSILKIINEELLIVVNRFRPDVLWIFKGMEIFPEILMTIKEKGILLVNYNPDHPFRFASRGSGNSNVLKSIQLYDHHFCYSIQIQKELESRFGVSASWLPFGYLKAQKNDSENLIRKVCFIGNPDNERARIINLLIENQLPVVLFGTNWDRYITNSDNHLVETYPPIFKEEFTNVAQQYVVQLNLFRKQNEGSHNMRTFEMPALGCLMLAPRSEEHLCLFQEGKEAEFYSNDEELIEKVTHLLNVEEHTIKAYRRFSYERSIASDYSYFNRSKEVFKLLENLMHKKA